MTTQKQKIINIDDLAELLPELKKDNKIVLCHGVFDLLHIGHIKYLESAKTAGDVLVVTVTPDKYVNKGPDRPAFTESLRCEAIAALEVVDYVALNKWPTAVETINLLKPDIYAKGSEYKVSENDLTGMIVEEQRALQENGGSMHFTDDIVFSSTKLLNQFSADYPEETRKFLQTVILEHGEKEVLRIIDRAQSLKVLVIGEAILDEYNYCEMIGIASKDPAIAVKYLSHERFCGGILAVANNIAGFCDTVDLIAMVGENETEEHFIREHLSQKVNPTFFYKRESPTIIKKRFVAEGTVIQKLFEVHNINTQDLDESEEKTLQEMIFSRIKDYDLVLVVDFGHGFISRNTARMISENATFLAVNTQANSGNKGFNVISKYPSADFICLNDLEIRLEERHHPGTVFDMVKSVSEKLSCPLTIVTQGKEGCICYNGESMLTIPAFAKKVVDRIGSGDAMIALASLCAVQRASVQITGMVGNAAASVAVSTVGHRSSIDKIAFKKYLSVLLK